MNVCSHRFASFCSYSIGFMLTCYPYGSKVQLVAVREKADGYHNGRNAVCKMLPRTKGAGLILQFSRL